MAETSLTWGKGFQIQEAQKGQKKLNPKRPTARYAIIILSKVKSRKES